MTSSEHIKQEIIQLLNEITDDGLLDLIFKLLLSERQQ